MRPDRPAEIEREYLADMPPREVIAVPELLAELHRLRAEIADHHRGHQYTTEHHRAVIDRAHDQQDATYTTIARLREQVANMEPVVLAAESRAAARCHSRDPAETERSRRPHECRCGAGYAGDCPVTIADDALVAATSPRKPVVKER